jgi:hypothetical protein
MPGGEPAGLACRTAGRAEQIVYTAFTPIWYSSNDFSVTIVGWHVRFESGRTLKKKIDLAERRERE